MSVGHNESTYLTFPAAALGEGGLSITKGWAWRPLEQCVSWLISLWCWFTGYFYLIQIQTERQVRDDANNTVCNTWMTFSLGRKSFVFVPSSYRHIAPSPAAFEFHWRTLFDTDLALISSGKQLLFYWWCRSSVINLLISTPYTEL